MNNVTKFILVLIVAALCISSAYALGYSLYHNPAQTTSITCDVCSIDDSGEVWLGVTQDGMEFLNASYGDDIIVEFGKDAFAAVYVKDYAGIPAYTTFLSYVSSKNGICFGVYGGKLSDYVNPNIGDSVILSLGGKNRYYSAMPDYAEGVSDDREDYPSDQAFSNYRILDGGDMKNGIIQRSSTPWTDGRGEISDSFLRNAGVDSLVCLDRDESELKEIAKQKPDLYASELYQNGKVKTRLLDKAILCNPKDVRWTLESILNSEGEVGLSCFYGKDHTGIFCLILQGLAGATLEEAKEEYMTSITNLYGIEKNSDEYEAVYLTTLFRTLFFIDYPDMLDRMLDVDWDAADLGHISLQSMVTDYLISYVGMTAEETDSLKERIAT